MFKLSIYTFFSSLLIFISCQNQKTTSHAASQESGEVNISYAIAQNYFVKNTFEGLDNPKITTQENFEKVFGMATTMGPEGKPSPIDFTKQYVIAVILPESNKQTSIEPISLSKNNKNEIVLDYKIHQGPEQSFTTVSHLLLIVDTVHEGAVILHEQSSNQG